jgi:hypothetical protein
MPPLFQVLVCLGISAFFLVCGFKAEAFYNRWTGKEIHAGLGRSICFVLGIAFFGLAVHGLMKL